MFRLQVLSLLSLFRPSFETCLTTHENVPCVFPFTYQGNTYTGCTNVTDTGGQYWCATQVDGDGLYVPHSKQYGYCGDGCPMNGEENVLVTRSIENTIDATDKECPENETCKDQEECPDFLKQKAILTTLARQGNEYKDALEKIKGRVCNRRQKAVCCLHKNDRVVCELGYPCLAEDQCEYTKELRKKYNSGNSEAKAELKGLICDRKEKKFCCPKVVVRKSPSRDETSTSISTSTSRDETSTSRDEKINSSWLPRKGECGVNPERPPSRVLGGEVTSPGEFPFTALLGYPALVKVKGRQVKQTRYKCGATLINYWYVVTAAHCQGANKGSQISTVRLGDWEVGVDPDCIRGTEICQNGVQDFLITAEQVTVHEDYGRVSGNIVNDIALVRLDRPAVLNSGVQIACLPVSLAEAAEELNLPDLSGGLTGTFPIVVGWGYTEYDPHVSGADQGDFAAYNVASRVQQKLEVPVLSTEKCREKWGGRFNAEESQICAGGEEDKDSCKGDSGGPLYLSRVASSGRPTVDGLSPFYLLGLVSFGSKLCGAGRPGVYTRLESFVPWIENQIGTGNL